MKPRTALPWISLLLIVVAALTPLGREILNNLSSGEQLSRTIAEFMAMVFFGGAFALALIEFGIRAALIRRARRRALVAGKSE